jgi:hypothetical protein
MAALRKTGLLHSFTGAAARLAGSVAMQVTVSACTAVVIGLTGTAWLTQANGPASPAAAPQPVLVVAPAAVLPPAALQPTSFAFGGVDALHAPTAFPMEEEARFSLSLSRPYKVLAAARWQDEPSPGLDQEELTRLTQLTEPQPQSQVHRRRAVGEAAHGEPGAVAVALPPPRPLDLAAFARPTAAEQAPSSLDAVPPSPETVPAAQPYAPAEAPRFVILPERLLPRPAELAGAVVSSVTDRADAARSALLRTVSWAANSVGATAPGN